MIIMKLNIIESTDAAKESVKAKLIEAGFTIFNDGNALFLIKE